MIDVYLKIVSVQGIGRIAIMNVWGFVWRTFDLESRSAGHPGELVVYPPVLVHDPAVCYGSGFLHTHGCHTPHAVTPPLTWRSGLDYKTLEFRQSEAVGGVEGHVRDGEVSPLDAPKGHP